MPDDVDDFPDAEEAADATSDDSEALGDAGKRALDAERQQRRAAQVEAKQLREELERLRKEGMPADERKLEEARQEGERRAAERHAARIVKAEVKALGAKKLEDPEDAVAFLGDLQGFVDDDGEVDAAALDKAIDKLIERKPYLAAKGAGRRRHGDGDGGDRGSADKPADMNTLIRSKARARA